MNTKLKAMILMLAVVISTAALSGYIAFSDDQAALESSIRRELTLVEKLLQNSIDTQIGKASARAALISSLPSVQQAFRARDRDQLIHQLLGPMTAQREQFDVREAQFHLPPASSYLRLFKLDEPPGEDLSSFRALVVATNQQQTPHEGISIGHRGISVRGVYPVADSEGHIGSFEIGMDFIDVVRNVKDITGFEAAMLVDRRLMRDIATQVPAPEDYKLLGDYQMVVATNWAFIKPLLSPEKLQIVRKPQQIVKVVGGETFGGATIPLRDPAGTVIGHALAIRSFDHYVKQRNWAIVRSAAMAGLQVLLLAGVVLLILNGMLLRPLGALTRMIDDTPEEIPGERNDLLQRRDEIGKLAQHLVLATEEKQAKSQLPGESEPGEEQANA